MKVDFLKPLLIQSVAFPNVFLRIDGKKKILERQIVGTK